MKDIQKQQMLASQRAGAIAAQQNITSKQLPTTSSRSNQLQTRSKQIQKQKPLLAQPTQPKKNCITSHSRQNLARQPNGDMHVSYNPNAAISRHPNYNPRSNQPIQKNRQPVTGRSYERSPSFFERLFCWRRGRQQKSALANRNTGQRKYVEEAASSSEEESESATEEEYDSDEAMDQDDQEQEEPAGSQAISSEDITSERVGFENQMDTSKAQTRQNFQDEELGQKFDFKEKIKGIHQQGKLHQYMKFIAGKVQKPDDRMNLQTFNKSKESILKEVKKYVAPANYQDFERSINEQPKLRNESTHNKVSASFQQKSSSQLAFIHKQAKPQLSQQNQPSNQTSSSTLPRFSSFAQPQQTAQTSAAQPHNTGNSFQPRQTQSSVSHSAQNPPFTVIHRSNSRDRPQLLQGNAPQFQMFNARSAQQSQTRNASLRQQSTIAQASNTPTPLSMMAAHNTQHIQRSQPQQASPQRLSAVVSQEPQDAGSSMQNAPQNSFKNVQNQPKENEELQNEQVLEQQLNINASPQYKNCSQAVIDRDKRLQMMHKLLKEENFIQRHQDLERFKRRQTALNLQRQNSSSKPGAGAGAPKGGADATSTQYGSTPSGQGNATGPKSSSQEAQQISSSGTIVGSCLTNTAEGRIDTAIDKSYLLEIDQNLDYKSLICPLCFQYIYKCQTTVCGHSFCTKCIDEYLIIKKTCFVCDKVIRTTKGSVLLPCFSIDDVITQLIQNSDDPDVKIQWENQKCEFTTWQLKKKLEKVEVGEKIDVRDTDYIWCIGTVRMVIESINHEPIIAIHYEGWNMWYDEFLPLNSPRIARLGFYTSRDDIPKYKMNPIAAASTSSASGQQNANNSQLTANQLAQRGLMQSLIVNRIPQSNWGSKKSSQMKNSAKNQKKKASPQELENMSEQERRRYENSTLGDALDDRVEDFFNKYQDANYNNGNNEFSGMPIMAQQTVSSAPQSANANEGATAESQMAHANRQLDNAAEAEEEAGADAALISENGPAGNAIRNPIASQRKDTVNNIDVENNQTMTNSQNQVEEDQQQALDDAIDAQIERLNMQQLQQGAVQPVFLRNAMQVLGAVGQGGQSIVNALLAPNASGQAHQHTVHLQVNNHLHPPPAPHPAPQVHQQQPLEGGGHHQNHFANLMRQIAGIREQANAAREAREARQAREAREARPAWRDAARDGARDANRNAPRNAARDAPREASRDPSRDADRENREEGGQNNNNNENN